MANITIVGGGLLGLGTGLLLLQRGHEVTVLERDGYAPGRTQRMEHVEALGRKQLARFSSLSELCGRNYGCG